MGERSKTVVATLLRLGVMGKDDWDVALQQVLEISCDLLEVDRASYWSFRDDPSAIVCELGYVRSKKILERGMVIHEDDSPEYLARIRAVQILAVKDAAAEPDMCALRRYLETHKIRALLDVPVFSQSQLVGILCHENATPRNWTGRDSELALTMSHTLSGLLAVRARNLAERSERRSAFLAQVSAAISQTFDPDHATALAVRRAIPVLGELATLVGCDPQHAWRVAAAHIDPEGQRHLDRYCAASPAGRGSTGLAMQALREGQSLLMPMADRETLRKAGHTEEQLDILAELQLRSVMCVLIRAHDAVTGVLTFASSTRNYDRDDLRFAESYAQQIGAQLENSRLYAQAQAAIRARDDFLHLAGHELRTPLTSLNFAVELLKKHLGPGASPAQRAVEAIERQARRLSRLAELIVLAASHNSDGLPLRFEPFDLAALARDITHDLSDMFKRSDCDLHVAADEPVLVDADRTGIEVAISNLLVNALKFGKGAPVELSVRREGDRAVLIVRDHGIGIPAERLTAIFGRYERAVSSDNFGGLGLGLYITAKIVDAHRGAVSVASRPGEGATFRVELPIAASP